MNKIYINKREISDNKPPFIIGEISANHSGSIKKIFNILEVAAEIGLDAIKIQTFDPNEMTLDFNKREFIVKNKFSTKSWNNRSLYSIYKEAYLPFKWHKKIFLKAKSLGLTLFSSVFDEKSLDLLIKLNSPAYKIASLESLHFPLIKKVIKTKRPLIISTGTLNIDEIFELNKFLKFNKCKNFSLLHCVTQYPADFKNLNLKTIQSLKKKLKIPIGYSDHSRGISSAISAVALGANIIEKHFKFSNKDKTLDSHFSLDPKEMKQLIIGCKNAWISTGVSKNKICLDEKIYSSYRRSIYAYKDIKKGDKFSSNNIKVIRPNKGLPPKYLNKIIGKKSKKNIKFATPITKELF